MGSAALAPAILARFPRHLEADQPGKLLGQVVASLAVDLDVLGGQLGGVRRARRLDFATEDRDLLLLAALHGLGAGDFGVLASRVASLRAVSAVLANASSTPDAVAATLAALPDLVGIASGAFPRFPAEGSDPGPARARLAAALAAAAGYASELDRLRARIRTVIALHRAGNGTVSAILSAAASALDLEVVTIVHAPGSWHAARCLDRFRLARPEPPGHVPSVTLLTPALDALVLEENPPADRSFDPTPRADGDVFHALRAGFEPVPATLRVVGVADRTVAPMVVDVGAGFGLVFLGTVADGVELRFQRDGTVRMGGADVSGHAFAFRGAVFADAAAPDLHDFTFADAGMPSGAPLPDRAGFFPITLPAGDVFDPAAAAGHAAGPLPPVELAVGETRFACFVRVGAFGPRADAAVPFTRSGIFDGSTFAPDPAAGEAEPAAAKVGLDWVEPETFAVRLWIPPRFERLDVAGELPVAERVRLALDRHRAAGVHVYAKAQDGTFKPPPGLLPGAT